MAKVKSALDGLKVVDFSWVVMIPLATRYLADFGATVVKVESIKRVDIARIMWPYAKGNPGVDMCTVFSNYNTNKYSIALNLKHPLGLDVAKRLITWSDVVVENQSPEAMERLGLGYEELRRVKPDVIMLRGSIQGQTGPNATQPGFGVNAMSLSGFTHLVGWPDRMPVGQNFAYTDFIAPWYAIIAIMAALEFRRKTGKGQLIDISQLEAALSFLSPALIDYTVNKRIQGATGNRCAYAAPHGVYRCKGDDRWCVIAIFSDKEWASFCRAIGKSDLTKDPKFASFLDRKRNEDELDRLVERWAMKYSPEQVMQIMQAAGIPAGVVQTNRDLLEHDLQLKHREYFWCLQHREMGDITVDGHSFKLSKTPARLRKAPPCLGEDTEFVCRNILGMSKEEFKELVENAEVFT